MPGPQINATSQRPRLQSFVVIALLGALLIGLPDTAAAVPQPSSNAIAQDDWAPPRTVYLPQTGHTISGVFLDVWREWNGAASFGYPITEEFEAGGRTVQYYEYARFEYWPNDPNGNVVQFGDIGRELMELQMDASGSNGAATSAATLARAAEPVAPETVDTSTPDRRFVSATGHTVQFGFKAFWEATGEASYLGYPVTEPYGVDGVTYQFFERGQLRWEPGTKVRMVPVGERLAARYNLDTSPIPQGNIPVYSEELFLPPQTPTPATSGRVQPDPAAEKWIEVNLSTQYLIAWQGDVRVNETYVSTGKSGFETPPGTYSIIVKKPVEDMEGVIGGEYYNVPDVPWVMYFTDVGHAFHGTYWHSNFGTPMSHGCVNLTIGFAEWLYNWAPLGTRVVIHY
ncbi:MAG: L,D-transpeptidase [Chloroflexota bacterium]|nr:L,D-transpeptidase [Chloroflexota bacterium]